MNKKEFFNYTLDTAKLVEKATGIDPFILQAWWSWESSYGENQGSKYNNLGGIKYTKYADYRADTTSKMYAGYNSLENYAKDFIRILNIKGYGYPEVLKSANKKGYEDIEQITKIFNESSYAESDYNVKTIKKRATEFKKFYESNKNRSSININPDTLDDETLKKYALIGGTVIALLTLLKD